MSSVAEEILAYLHKHPNANDTVEGIATYWLQERPQHIVQKALDELVLNGRINVRASADGRQHYSAGAEKKLP